MLAAPTGCVQKRSCLNVFIDFYERIWYNIFILQVPPMHRSERNLDVRAGIMPTIHPIYRRNNLENNLQNNGINFSKQPVVFENKPTIAITKAKARATAKATAKAITKENLSSCQADKPPRERSFLFLDRMILVKRRMAVQEAFALERTNPSASRSFGTSPSRGGKGAARRACTLIWVLAEIRGYGRMLSVPWFKWGSWFHSTRMPPDYSNDFVTNHNRLNCTGSNCFVRVLPF